MPALRISPVETEADLREFLALPERLYAGDPGWCAPLHLLRRRSLSARNPFLRSTTLRLFLARRDGKVVGSISALRDPSHERTQQEKASFFGFFECEDDPEIASALLDRASEEARGWGAEILRGPRCLSRVEEVGVLVEGQGSPQPMMSGHSRPYYARLVEGCGLVPHHDVLAYDAELYEADGSPRPYPEALERKAAAVAIPDLVLRPLSWRHLDADLGLAHTIFVDAFRNVPENTPMPRDQFVALGRALALLTDRRMIQLATVHGQPAGFAISFPDVNQVLGAAQGRLWPLGWARALRAWRNKRTAAFKLIGVMPPYRGTGLQMKLIRAAVEGIRASGFRRIEASLIDERNAASRGTVESIGLKVYRRYRLYDRAL